MQYQDVVRDQTQRGTNENERATRDTRGAPEQRFVFDDEDYMLAVEAGDMDAARLVLSIGVPRVKPINPPLDCLADMPLPERPKDLGRTAAFLLEQVAAGKLSTADAESVLSLAKRAVDLKQLGKPFSVDDFTL